MNEEMIKEKFEEGMNQGYSHMFVLKDVFDGTDRYFYVLLGQDVDSAVDNLTCVDTYRLVGIFNYTMDIDKQISELKDLERKRQSYILSLNK